MEVGFHGGDGQDPRRVEVPARSVAAVGEEIRLAKKRFGLSAKAPVVSCYEAGRDGFWLHRCLVAAGVRNVVVDSASIEVNRRLRRAETDRLDLDDRAIQGRLDLPIGVKAAETRRLADPEG